MFETKCMVFDLKYFYFSRYSDIFTISLRENSRFYQTRYLEPCRKFENLRALRLLFRRIFVNNAWTLELQRATIFEQMLVCRTYQRCTKMHCRSHLSMLATALEEHVFINVAAIVLAMVTVRIRIFTI